MAGELMAFSTNHEDLTACDIFSLGATMYEVCLGCPLPQNGEEWQAIRNGKLREMTDTSMFLQDIIKGMMHPNNNARPVATALLDLASRGQAELECSTTEADGL